MRMQKNTRGVCASLYGGPWMLFLVFFLVIFFTICFYFNYLLKLFIIHCYLFIPYFFNLTYEKEHGIKK